VNSSMGAQKAANSRAVAERPARPLPTADHRGRVAWTLLLFFVLSAAPLRVFAGPPTEQLRGAIDRAIEILKKPEPAAKAKRGERRDLLRREIKPVFDFQEMAKRALGPNWRQRTPKERQEFVALFQELLENSYLGKIESYQGEKIEYRKETVDPPYAEVGTVVITGKGQEIPIDYRMLDEGGRWRIYDVVVEGISLVNNYRSQFNSILQKSSYDEMVRRLRATVKESEGG
jgi:phospholipid transport system substrate-binding protein